MVSIRDHIKVHDDLEFPVNTVAEIIITERKATSFHNLQKNSGKMIEVNANKKTKVDKTLWALSFLTSFATITNRKQYKKITIK